MTKKIFVLDTNVLLSDPKALFSFQDNDIVIPIVVIEELDRFKKDMTRIGFAARAFSRYIDSIRERGDLIKGVQLKEGGTLRIELTTEVDLPGMDFKGSVTDNIILSAALRVMKDNPTTQVVLVSKDINMRIKGDALGIKAETYTTESINYTKLPRGFRNFTVEGALIDRLHTEKAVPFDELPEQIAAELYPNEFIMLQDEHNEQHQAVGRIDPFRSAMVPLSLYRSVWGIKARNFAQKLSLDLLMDDRVNLVSLMGIAGTGKTLLAIAAGLQKCFEEGKYSRMLVARPIYPMGKDIGYLPGTIQEKLKPWMQPIFDNLEYLIAGTQSATYTRVGDLLHSGMLDVEPLTYIRGRSIPEQFIIVDEAQNLTPHEMKTIVSRAGENTKIVLTGDPFQIDNPYMNESNNGLSYIVDRFRDLNLAGHMILEKGERSPLANAAAEYL